MNILYKSQAVSLISLIIFKRPVYSYSSLGKYYGEKYSYETAAEKMIHQTKRQHVGRNSYINDVKINYLWWESQVTPKMFGILRLKAATEQGRFLR